MTSARPDFRKATLDEIRDGISTLNKAIVELRKDMGKEGRKYWAGLGAGTAGAATASVLLPPVGIIIMAGTTIYCIDKAARRGLTRALVQDMEKLRDQFKAVYRARPGRKQFNLASRREREKARVRKHPRYYGGFW